MAVVSSKSAPCVVTVPPPVPAAQGDVEATAPAAGEEASDANEGNEASAYSNSFSVDKEESTSKPAPKPAFTAPKTWMVVFGVVLALCAGVVDVVTSRSLQVFVSHVTGTVARVGMRIEGVTTGMNEGWDEAHSVLLVVSFITGSFLCGLVIPKNQVNFGGKSFYGIALLGNSALLFTAANAAPETPVYGGDVTQARAVLAGCLAAMACGLQNAMCTMHFGAVVRTTHVTGTATDIGSTAGRAAMILLRGGCRRRGRGEFEKVELRDDVTKLCVLLPIFAGFLCGTILGAFLHSAMGVRALFVPAIVTGSTGFAYSFFRNNMKRQLKKLEEWQLKAELDEMEEVIRKAHSHMESVRSHRSGKSREEGFEDLEGFIGQSLRVMQGVEQTIAELCDNDTLMSHYHTRRSNRSTTV